MSKSYRLNEKDKQIVAAVERLLKNLVHSNSLSPAELVSVAKVLHVLSRLPRATEDVCVKIELSWRTEYKGGSSTSIWHFFAGTDSLTLSCGSWESVDGVGSDSTTTMYWTARPGERTDYDGGWDHLWMEQESDDSEMPANSTGSKGRSVEVIDDDNPLLFEPEITSEEIEDPPIEIFRRGEKIDLALEEWRAALETFKDWGWEPEKGFERYAAPLAFVKQDEGKAMQNAGNLLWREIDKNAILAETVDLDIDLFLQLTQFVGRGAFVVGKMGAFDDATRNDFQDQ